MFLDPNSPISFMTQNTGDLQTFKAEIGIFMLVHGQVTIIFVVSVGLSVSLSVCAEFFSAVFDPISIKLGHVICLGLVVSPRIYGLCDAWGLGDP